MASLEGWSSTIELHPHISVETRISLEHATVDGSLSIHGNFGRDSNYWLEARSTKDERSVN
jgi:hypothetical protein